MTGSVRHFSLVPAGEHSVKQHEGSWYVLAPSGDPVGVYTEAQDGVEAEFLARVHLVEIDGRLEALARGLGMSPVRVVRALTSALRRVV